MDLGGYKSGGVEEETGGSAREGGTYFGPGGGRGKKGEGGPRVNEGVEAGATTESRRRQRRWKWW